MPATIKNIDVEEEEEERSKSLLREMVQFKEMIIAKTIQRNQEYNERTHNSKCLLQLQIKKK